MAEEPVFRGIIDFFVKLGIYDVILPFLLVFSVVFAILEKTKVFGTETVDGHEVTRKNINAMVAFVIAFLVIASKKLVETINKALANIVLLLLLIVMFLMLIGAFFQKGEDVSLKEGGWRTTFMVIIFVAIVLIFLNAIPTDDGGNWLSVAWYWLIDNWDGNVAGSVILIIVVIIFVVILTRDRKSSEKSSGSSGGSH